jgi:hypothetical protein
LTVNVRLAIVTVPVRIGPGFAPTVSCTVPLPEPFPPDTLIQEALLPDVQLHVAPVVTATDVCPPAASTDTCSGAIVNVQDSPWFTVNVRPAIVAVPAREPPVFGSIESWTAPLPEPRSPDVTLIQGTLLVDDQLQPAVAATFTVVVPPCDGAWNCSGEIVKAHAPAWWTVNVRPAIVSVPSRATPECDPAKNDTVPLPVPLAPDVIDSHPALLVAVQLQVPPVLTVTLPFPPLPGTVWLSADSE